VSLGQILLLLAGAIQPSDELNIQNLMVDKKERSKGRPLVEMGVCYTVLVANVKSW
jgi:hypothetical protein